MVFPFSTWALSHLVEPAAKALVDQGEFIQAVMEVGCMWNKVFTGFGYWDVISWLIFFYRLLALWLRSVGRRDYKEEQSRMRFIGLVTSSLKMGRKFLCRSSSYWGFRKALEPYYKVLISMHSGHMRDYMGYFVLPPQ